MLIIESYSVAVLLCVLAMLCWGSWQNTQKLAPGWRFELYYWDFVVGIFIFSLVLALTIGNTGTQGRGFVEDIAQADSGNMLSAILGGIIWNLGTLLLVAAIAIAGMSVAFPIGGGIGWVLGIIVNYVAAPVGHPIVLFAGVFFIVIAILFSMRSYKRLTDETKKPTFKGIFLSFTAGLLIAFYYRFVASSLATNFANPEAGALTIYTALVLFAVGALISTFIFNPFFMRKPVEGAPVSFADYKKGSGKIHLVGMLGGIIWCIGNTSSFMASEEAGFAISYGLSNAAPIVAAIWGIFVWKEFSKAPKGTSNLLAFMFLFYLIGLVLIVYARLV